MTETILTMLRRLLVDDYYGLKQRLARRFGSADFASEVLHEAWMRLDRIDANASSAAVHNPKAYLYRIALNVATDRQRADKSWLSKIEIEALYRRAQDDLDPARIVEARLELDALANAINELPPRRRAVFIAARLEHLPYKVIAERHGITLRVVDRELKAALDHLSEVLNKNPPAGGGTGAPEASKI
ncbi:RNA polymerase sigma factor [Hyphomicrobium sp. 2TAF46]|uniref:RNA polymerase sigma factor n=1 Tax=Hyphomicrobium sp. 2TAF46 TaxID=3233019 RepID=UPI003F9110DC